MTQLDVMYRYDRPPGEATMMALGKVREVYGIRNLALNERERTIRLEFDATRLTDASVHALLRRTGLDLVEKVSLVPGQPPAETVNIPANAK